MAQGAGGGRPTKYKPAYCKQAKALTKLGATEREVAEFFEVDERTLNRWKHTHPKFCQSLKPGKAHSDKRVEQSLYRRATGYSYDAVKIFQVEGRPLIVPYVEHVPPDPTAMIFWLKNRRKDRWRDFKATEISTPPGRPLEMAAVPPSQMLLQDYYAKVTQSAAAADSDPAATRPVGQPRREWEEPEDDPGSSPR
jgi:hypothetical protein